VYRAVGAGIRPQHVHNDDYWGDRTNPADVVRDFERVDPRSAELRGLLLEF
jgi:hypothetical protein